jgi:uncharacterized Zn finger protein
MVRKNMPQRLAWKKTGHLLTIRVKQKKPQSVAALGIYKYVAHPSSKAYQVCKEASQKVKEWETVRSCILSYLENGKLPWKHSEWPLPQPDIEYSWSKIGRDYPMIRELISIFIFEKNPEKVLSWYDRGVAERGWRFGFNTDEIADAIKIYSPERAVAMWQATAEGLINRVNPRAYEDAAGYLKKAKKVMNEINKQDTWDKYIMGLRNTHIRKKRLLEILDRMNKNTIVKIKG